MVAPGRTPEARLLELSQAVDEAKAEKARLEGRKEELVKQLKALGCSSLEEAQKKLSESNAEVARLETELDGRLTKLEKVYGLA